MMKYRSLTYFSIEYYKETGKLYVSETAMIEVDWILNDGPPIPYMQDAVDAVREMKKARKLPGLSGGWDGPIRVCHPAGYPVLIL